MLDLLLTGKYNTDKSEGHLQVYSKLFGHKKSSVKSVLEIGIRDGGSVELFRDYFQNAQIIGLDLQLPILKDKTRIALEYADQTNSQTMELLGAKYSMLDFIVDDGCHNGSAIATSFKALWPYLVPGGYYAIEDWGVSYWPHWVDKPLPVLHWLIDECAKDNSINHVGIYSGISEPSVLPEREKLYAPCSLIIVQKRPNF